MVIWLNTKFFSEQGEYIFETVLHSLATAGNKMVCF